MERIADSVVADERRYQANMEREARLEVLAADHAEGLMLKGQRYYPYAVGNMEDAFNDMPSLVLEKLAEAFESNDEAMAGMILGCWFRAYVKPLAVELVMDKIELWEL